MVISCAIQPLLCAHSERGVLSHRSVTVADEEQVSEEKRVGPSFPTLAAISCEMVDVHAQASLQWIKGPLRLAVDEPFALVVLVLPALNATLGRRFVVKDFSNLMVTCIKGVK